MPSSKNCNWGGLINISSIVSFRPSRHFFLHFFYHFFVIIVIVWQINKYKYSMEFLVVYHLPQIPGNSCWDINGRLFWFVSLENSRDKRKLWKGSPVFPVGTFRMENFYHLQVSWVSYYSEISIKRTPSGPSQVSA